MLRAQGQYYATSQPKLAKLHTNPVVRARAEADLRRKYSTEQLSGRPRRQFPDPWEMQVSAETIHQSTDSSSRCTTAFLNGSE